MQTVAMTMTTQEALLATAAAVPIPEPSPVRIPDSPTVLLRRTELAAALSALGYTTSASTLATVACRPGKHGGPPYRIWGRIPLYPWGPALEWAQARLSAPRRNTSEVLPIPAGR